MERVVRRSELQSDEEELETSSEKETLSQHRPQTSFEFVKQNIQADNGNAEINDAIDDDELEFCLFAPSVSVSNTQDTLKPVAKIRLQSPEAQDTEPGFTRPQRDQSYYFTGTTSDDQQQRLAESAFTGDQIVAQSRIPWGGSAYAWRAIHIPCKRKQRLSLAASNAIYEKLLGPAIPTTRKRKGKAARIKVRKQIADRKAKEAQKRKQADESEVADREKRTRRNREKKVKKKLREKAKKQSATEGDAQDSDISD
jgi:hypothetical protein